VWAVVALVAAALVAFIMPTYRQGEASVYGKSAEDFATTIGGKAGKLSDFRGKVVVLNFWATWCPPCIEETPALERLEKHIAGRGGVVLGVSVDEDQAAYEKFLREHGITFPTFRDPSRKIPLAYGTNLFPDTYVIDRHGKLMRKFMSAQDWDSPEMLSYFDSILAQQ
jgi:cytochrome c biogenesis protein CcmG, thiol:disulfide interchange protein DsbE